MVEQTVLDVSQEAHFQQTLIHKLLRAKRHSNQGLFYCWSHCMALKRQVQFFDTNHDLDDELNEVYNFSEFLGFQNKLQHCIILSLFLSPSLSLSLSLSLPICSSHAVQCWIGPHVINLSTSDVELSTRSSTEPPCSRHYAEDFLAKIFQI